MKYIFPQSLTNPDLTQDIIVADIPSELVERIQSAEAKFLSTIGDDTILDIHSNMRNFHRELAELPYRGYENYVSYMKSSPDERQLATAVYREQASGEMTLGERISRGLIGCNAHSVLLKHTLKSGKKWGIYRSLKDDGTTNLHTELLIPHDFGHLRIDPSKQLLYAQRGFDNYVVDDLEFAVCYEQNPILPVD